MPTTNGGTIKYGVQFDVNKNGLNQLTKSFQEIQNLSKKNPLDENLKKAASTAKELEGILNRSWNDKLNQLNLDKFNQSIKSSYGSVDELRSRLASAGTAGQMAFNNMATQILNTNVQLRQSNKLLDDLATSMSNTVKWGITSSIFNNITSSIQQAYYYSKDLDRSLNNIRIVTGDSADQMDRFARTANTAAKDLGRSTLDYTKAALSFYQQGLGEEDVAARTAITLKAQNITGVGTEMVDYLTAVWNGFQVTADQTEGYVDKLAKVADASASDMSQLAIAMSKVASTANVMGVDVDQLTAQLATVIAATRQAPEAVGTAFKTIYSRLNDIKAGTDDAEISLGNYSGQMAALGFNVLDASGKLRDTGQVIEQIGSRWSTLSKEQQVSLAQIMGGMRQVNQITALFQNWTMYSELLNDSLTAQGTLNEKNDVYLDSMAAHLEKLSAEAERTYDILFDPDTINIFTDALNGVLTSFNDFIDGIGGGANAFAYFGSVVAGIFNNQIAQGIVGVQQQIQRVQANLGSLQAKASIINNIKANIEASYAGSGKSLGQNALQAQAEAAEKTLAVQRGLTAEQQKQSVEIQKQIGLTQQEIDDLERESKERSANIAKFREANSLQEANIYKIEEKSNIEQQYVKSLDQELIAFNKIEQASSNQKLTDEQRLALWQQMMHHQDSMQQKYIKAGGTVQQFKASWGQVLDDIILGEQHLQAWHDIENTLRNDRDQHKTALQQIDYLLKNIGIDTTKISEADKQRLANLLRQNDALADQGKHVIDLQKNIKKISAAGQILTTIGGALATRLDKSATSAMRLNAIFSGVSGTVAGIANYFVPGSGLLIQGVFSLGQTLLKVTGIWDYMEQGLKTSTEKVQQFHDKVKEINTINRQKNAQISYLESIQEEYARLSDKAGAYGSTIENLTDDQKQRYWELTDKFTSYNDAVIAGYDEQGHAIVRGQDALKDTIEVLKEAKREAIAASLGDVNTLKENFNANRQSRINAIQGQINENNDSIDILNDQLNENAQIKYKRAGSNLKDLLNSTIDKFGEDFRDQQVTIKDLYGFEKDGQDTIQGLLNSMEDAWVRGTEKGFADFESDGWSQFLFSAEILLNEIEKKGITEKDKSDLQKLRKILFNKSGVEDINADIQASINEKLQTNKVLGKQLEEAGKLTSEEINQIITHIQTQDYIQWDKLVQIGNKTGTSESYLTMVLYDFLQGLSIDFDGGKEKVKEKIIELQQVLTDSGEAINKAIEKGTQNAIKILQNQDGFSAEEVKQQIKNSINENIINSDDIQEILKTLYDNNSDNDAAAQYFLDLLAGIYNIENIQTTLRTQSDGSKKVLINAFSVETDKLIEDIATVFEQTDTGVATESAKKVVQEIIEELGLTPEQIKIVNDNIKSFRPGLDNFETWVTNLINNLDKTTGSSQIVQNVDKIISDVNKIVSGKDLTWKDKYNEKTGLASILNLTEEELQELETNEDWLEKIIEKIDGQLEEGSAARIAIKEAIYHDMDSIKKLDPNDADYAQLWDTAFHNQLENLKINQAALKEYAQIKGQTFGDENKTKQAILNMYKIEAGLSGLENQAKSLQKALEDGKADLQTANFVGELTDLFGGQLEGFDHNYIVEHIDAIVWALGQGVSSAEEFKKAVQNYNPTEEQKKNLQEYMDTYSSIASQLLDGKTVSQDQINQLLKTIEELSSDYPQLLEYVDVLNNEWLKGTDQYTEALLKVQQLLSEISLQELIDDLDEAYVHIDVDPTDFDDWAEHVEDFLNIDRQISIAVRSNMEEEFDNISQQLDSLYNAAGKIGQNFIVAAKDIAELSTVFPGIMQGMQMLDDGSYQLNSNIVQRAIATAQTEAHTNAASIAERLRDEAAYHDAKADIYDQIAAAADKLAGDQVLSETQAANAKTTIYNGLRNIRSKNAERSAKQQNKNLKEVADSSKKNFDAVAYNSTQSAQHSAIAFYQMTSSASKNLATMAQVYRAALNGGTVEGWSLDIPRIDPFTGGIGGQEVSITEPDTSPVEDAFNAGDYATTSREARKRAAEERAAAEKARGQAAAVEGQDKRTSFGMDNVSHGKGINPKTGKSSGSNKGGKSSGSSGRNKNTKQTSTAEQKTIDQTVDRYHDINNIIKQIGRSIDRIEQKQKKLVGLGLVKSLQQELKLINQQKKAYEEKLKLQRQERKEMQDALTRQGVSFNSDGTIANYGDALRKAMDETNRAIAEYNKYIKQGDDLINGNPNISDESKNAIKESQETYKKQIQAAEQKYKKFKQTLTDYDKLVNDEIEETKDNIQKLSDQQIQIRVKKANVMVELRLETEDFKRDWINFKKDVLEGLTFEDAKSVYRNSSKNMDLIRTYYDPDAINDADKGTLYTTTKKVGELVKQIEKIKSGNYSGTYGDNIALAYQDLKKYEQEAMKAAKSLRDLVNQMAEAVIKSIEQAKDAFNDHINQYKQIGKLLDHQAKVIELLYGDKAYDLMNKYYSAQQANNNAQLNFLKLERAEWQRRLQEELAYRETLTEGSEEYAVSTEKIDRFKKYLQETIESLNTEVENALSNLIDKYHNAIEKTFDELEKKITNGKSLQRIGEEWELINQHADMYLDNVNRIYEIDKLRNTYEKAINDNQGNLKAQKSLTDMMKEQLKFLKDKEKISQYDIDRANTLLDIEVKRLALEEQRNQKTRLRLRRDAQGNYTYEYTGIQDSANEILEASQALRDAQMDLYNMTKEHYKENLKDYYSTIQEMNEKIKQLYEDNTLSEQERNERIIQLRKLYEPILNDLTQDNIILRQNMYNDAVQTLADLYERDTQNFNESQEAILKKAEETIYADKDGVVALWDSGIQQMISRVKDQGGLEPTYTQAMINMDQATAEFKQGIEDVESIAEISFSNIEDYIESAQDETEELKEDNDELISSYGELINNVEDLYNKAMDLWHAFQNDRDGMMSAVNAGENLIRTIDRVTTAYDNLNDSIERAAEAAANADFTIETTYIEHHITDRQDSGGSSSGGGTYDNNGGVTFDTGGTSNYNPPSNYNYNYNQGYGGPSKGGAGYSRGTPTPRVKRVEVRTPTAGGWWTERIYFTDGTYEDRRTNKSFADKVGAVKGSFDTGGYTGSWGSDGRLAVLHEKELVLNKEDTQNILSAVDIVRTLDNLTKNIQDNTQAASYIRSLGGINETGSLDQNVRIEASFPNVTRSSEIEDAFNNLINRASQYAFKHSY